MDGKLTVTELAQILAKESQMSQSAAEIFVKAVFDVVTEAVLSDKIVKVKGLGTFKLIGVSDRESVNVNTGERILIAGHSKLSFTPDMALKNAVNRPFADFETVILNEKTPIEEMERVSDEGQDELVAPEGSDSDVMSETDVVVDNVKAVEANSDETGADGQEISSDEAGTDEQKVNSDEVGVEDVIADGAGADETESGEYVSPANDIDDVVQQPGTDSASDSDEPSSVSDEPASVSDEPASVFDEPASVIDSDSVGPDVQVTQDMVMLGTAGKGRLHGWIWACVTLCVSVGMYFLGYYRVLDGITIRIERQETLPKHDESVQPAVSTVPVKKKTVRSQKAVVGESKDSVALAGRDSAAVAPSSAEPAKHTKPEKPAEPSPEVLARNYRQVEGGDYWIVGDMGVVHKMQVGETLYRVAGKELGSQKLMPYLVVFNDFKDPNLIRIGDPIRIPKLVRKY